MESLAATQASCAVIVAHAGYRLVSQLNSGESCGRRGGQRGVGKGGSTRARVRARAGRASYSSSWQRRGQQACNDREASGRTREHRPGQHPPQGASHRSAPRQVSTHLGDAASEALIHVMVRVYESGDDHAAAAVHNLRRGT